MKASVCEPDDSQDCTECEMGAGQLNRSQYSKFDAFFWEPNLA